jgi:hypothetical protein
MSSLDRLRVTKMAIHRGDHWTPEEDRRLIELIDGGKSSVLIAALLKRNQRSIQDRARYLKREAAKRSHQTS